MRRLVGIFAAITLALAGCGTSGGAAASAAAPKSSVEASADKTDDGSAASTEPNDPLGFGKDANTATVTVDGETYEFSDLFCVALGGAIGAHSVGSGFAVNIDLPPVDWETSGEGWEPPSIRLNGNEPYVDLRAGGPMDTSSFGIEPGMSQVDSFDSDGHHAAGTATFIDLQATMMGEAPTPMEATFEVTCPES